MAEDHKSNGETEKKEKKSVEYINLKVCEQEGTEVLFKIKRTTPMRKLMKAFTEKTAMRYETSRFRFDGDPINETDTPNSLGLEDGDCIDAFAQQTGGFVNM
ncbi:Small ubiquitin-related modifier 1 [Intoshia linei]|uniref:Small ubiquitin-related modifier 1 n=1 Tax=Intoshia linei TaxID=1819745 RepID=A0A177ARJ8_9BILA|nr:Small ubiquitin-related modifier 1 [Intoshia linei]